MGTPSDDGRPLPALLSQVLVAFTLELDNRFERRMGDAGNPGACLSYAIWANLLRFVGEGGTAVRKIAALAMAPETRIRHQLGCLERWRFIELAEGGYGRAGWGSGRGIRSDWLVGLTARGRAAVAIWPPVESEMERRWEARFGKKAIGSLRRAMEDVLAAIGLELPLALPGIWEAGVKYPERQSANAAPLPLLALLSQLLLAFTIEFEGESRAPLAHCANTLRVLGEQPVPLAEIPRLTGSSPETTAIGWQLKPYVAVEPGGARRGKVARLTPLGRQAQERYWELTGEIGKRWESRFGKAKIGAIREALRDLFTARDGERLLLAEGLVPDEGTRRAGEQTASLGRATMGAAARQRMRDTVAQTEMFRRDPAGTLPHYPLWDMNRGFGP